MWNLLESDSEKWIKGIQLLVDPDLIQFRLGEDDGEEKSFSQQVQWSRELISCLRTFKNQGRDTYVQ